jgi:hypothetical protein
LVFIAKRWAKGFRIEDKDVEERKKYVYVCAHTKKKKKREKRKEERKKRKIQGKARRI